MSPRRLTQLSVFLLVFAAAFWCVDGGLRWSSIRSLTEAGLGEASGSGVRPSADARAVVLPLGELDAGWWLLHTGDALQEGGRVRGTKRDNAPAGREVHWNSGLMAWTAALAWPAYAWGGKPWEDALPEAALFAGPLLFAVLLVLSWFLLARSVGRPTALLFCALLACAGAVQEFQRAGELDHHGMVSILLALASLCAAAAFLPGLPRTHRVRSLTASGCCGAAALWVSAATAVPVLAGIGLGAVGAALLRRGAGGGADEETPVLWRYWGRVGALSALGFYVVEYLPSHAGWRLEVNHPLYALAWWGGAEVVAAVVGASAGVRRSVSWQTALGLAALVALPGVVVWRGTSVFLVGDPFLWQLHRDYILEFRSLAFVLQLSGPWAVPLLWAAVPLAVWWLWRQGRGQPERAAALLITLGAVLPPAMLMLAQARWHGTALVVGCAAVALWAGYLAEERPGSGRPVGGRWCWALVVLACLQAPVLGLAGWALRGWDTRQIDEGNATVLEARRAAWALARMGGARTPVVLSSPSVSSQLAYFGGVRVLGTLYWENVEGLRAAARIYAQTDPAETLRLLQAAGVTHVAVASWDPYFTEYTTLARAHGLAEGEGPGVLERAATGGELPGWLRPIEHRLQTDIAKNGRWLRLYEVAPSLPPSEQARNRARALAAAGNIPGAVAELEKAWAHDRSSPQLGADLVVGLVAVGRREDARRVREQLPPEWELSLRRVTEIPAPK